MPESAAKRRTTRVSYEVGRLRPRCILAVFGVGQGRPTLPGLSADIGDDFLEVFLHALAVNLAGALGADFIGGEPIRLGFDNRTKFGPKALEIVGLEAALEDAVLHTHAPVFADFGDAVEAFGAGDIVGDEGEHLVGAATVVGEIAGGGEERWKPVRRGGGIINVQ